VPTTYSDRTQKSFSSFPGDDAATVTFALVDMPNFGDDNIVDSVTMLSGGNTIYMSGAWDNDEVGVSVRIMSGATVMAAADSGGTYETVIAPSTTIWTSAQAFPEVAFTWVNDSTTKAQWDAAVVEYRQDYSNNMGGDNAYVIVGGLTDGVELVWSGPTYINGSTEVLQTTANQGSVTLLSTIEVAMPDAASVGDMIIVLLGSTVNVDNLKIIPPSAADWINLQPGTVQGDGAFFAFAKPATGNENGEITHWGIDYHTLGQTGVGASYVSPRSAGSMPAIISQARVYTGRKFSGLPGPVATYGMGGDIMAGVAMVSPPTYATDPEKLNTSLTMVIDTLKVGGGLKHTFGVKPDLAVPSPAWIDMPRNLGRIGIPWLRDGCGDGCAGGGVSDDAWAAGGYYGSNDAYEYLEAFDGTVWTHGAKMPGVTNANERMNLHSYSGATSPTTATISSGTSGSNSFKPDTFIYDGTAFATGTARTVNNRDGAAIGDAGDMLFVGGYEVTSSVGNSVTTVDSFDGTTWTAETSLTSSRGSAPLVGTGSSDAQVFCGHQYSGGHVYLDSTATFNGTTWTAGTTYPITGRYGVALGAVDAAAIIGVTTSLSTSKPGYTYDGTAFTAWIDDTDTVGNAAATRDTDYVNGMWIGTFNKRLGYAVPNDRISLDSANLDKDATGFGIVIGFPKLAETDVVPPGAITIVPSKPGKVRIKHYKIKIEKIKTRPAHEARMVFLGLSPILSIEVTSPDRTVTGTTEALTLTGNDATVIQGIDRTVTGTTEAITWDDNDATVFKGVDRIVTGTTEALTWADNDATVSQGRDYPSVSEVLELATNTGVVVKSRAAVGATEALALGTNPALVSQGRDSTAQPESLLWDDNDATVEKVVTRDVTGTTESLLWDDNNATVFKGIDHTVTGTTESLLWDDNDATIFKGIDRTVTGSTEVLTWADNDATVFKGVDKTITGTTEVLTWADNDATIFKGVDRTVAGTTEVLTWADNDATVQTDRETTGTTEVLEWDDLNAQIFKGVDRTVSGNIEVLRWDDNDASITTSRDATGTTEALELAGNQATIFKGIDRTISGATEALEWDDTDATVTTTRTVAGDTEALELTSNNATIFKGVDYSVTGTTEVLTWADNDAFVDKGLTVAGATEVLLWADNDATIFKGVDRPVVGTTEVLEVVGNDATVFKGEARTVVGTTEALVWDDTDADVSLGRDAIGAPEALLWADNDATVATARGVSGTTEALEWDDTNAQIGKGTDRTISGNTEALVWGDNDAAIITDRDVTGSAEALLWDDTDATIFRGVDRTITGTTEAIVWDDTDATVGTGRDTNGLTEQLVVQTTTATIGRGVNRTVAGTTEALLWDDTNAQIGKGIDRNVSGNTEAVVWTSNDATVDQARPVAGATESLLFTGNDAVVEKDSDRTVVGTPESLLLTGNDATVDKTTDRDVVGTTETLEWSDNDATIAKSREIIGLTEQLVVSTNQAQIEKGADRDVVGTTESLVLTTNDATIGLGWTVVGTTEVLETTTNSGTIQRSRDVAGTTEALETTVYPADVDKNSPHVVEGTTEVLVVTVYPAQVTKVTVSQTHLWYGREGVKIAGGGTGVVLYAPVNDVIALTETSVEPEPEGGVG
jgi:hypothetical protein